MPKKFDISLDASMEICSFVIFSPPGLYSSVDTTRGQGIVRVVVVVVPLHGLAPTYPSL